MRYRKKIQHSLAKLAKLFYVRSHAVLKETAKLSGSIAILSAAPRDGSIGAENAAPDRQEGRGKEFHPNVADNPLITLDSLPNMEGNVIFGPF
ncbi:MAG TPA: hypothetical protein VJY34_22950 [Roseiarcus sp.]|nr:hypothetical protein [Roseiarcus sp.]